MTSSSSVVTSAHVPWWKPYLVELLQVMKALQDPAVLPLPVLPADECGTLLCRRPTVQVLLQGKISRPETVSILVPHLQEELRGWKKYTGEKLRWESPVGPLVGFEINICRSPPLARCSRCCCPTSSSAPWKYSGRGSGAVLESHRKTQSSVWLHGYTQKRTYT